VASISLTGGKAAHIDLSASAERSFRHDHHQGCGLQRGRSDRLPGHAEHRALWRAFTGSTRSFGTHDHFWDPLDKRYIDFETPFDTTKQMILPAEFFAVFHTRVGDAMTPEQRSSSRTESTRWQISAILHGEQGALSLSASLCHILKDPGAQEYAANQTREEARHVTGFTNYVKARWARRCRAAQRLRIS